MVPFRVIGSASKMVALLAPRLQNFFNELPFLNAC